MSKSVSLKILGRKLVKLDCKILWFDLEMSWMDPVASLLFILIMSNFKKQVTILHVDAPSG